MAPVDKRLRGVGVLRQSQRIWFIISIDTISGRVGRASATETVDSDFIPGRVKPKTIKIGIYSFLA